MSSIFCFKLDRMDKNDVKYNNKKETLILKNNPQKTLGKKTAISTGTFRDTHEFTTI